jgi:hypothetical protein
VIPFAQRGAADAPGDIVTVFSQTINSGNSGDADFSYRNNIPMSDGARTQIRVTVAAPAGSPFGVDNVSIAFPQTSPNARGVPIEVFFDGKSGPGQLVAGQSITSDWVNFSGFAKGDTILVILDLASTNGNAGFGTASVTGATFYFLAAANSYNVAAYTAGGSVANQVQGISKIEVR